MRPTITEIDTSALRRNYAVLRRRICAAAGPQALTVAVVKANAYGHGLEVCVRALLAEGAPWLGVTCMAEAQALRSAAAIGSTRILVMSGFFPGEEGLVLRHGVAPQLWEAWQFSLLDAAARRAGMPAASVPVHLEIDTGMRRQGVPPGTALTHLLQSAGLAGSESPLFVEGVLTHFSSPETPENGVLAAQCTRLAAALEQLHAAGVRPRLLHAGNSINALQGIELSRLAALAATYGCTLMVRPGLALYGCGLHAAERDLELTPVLRWRTQVTSIHTLQPGDTVGYNETFRAPSQTAVQGPPVRVALIPVGYADGLDRSLSNRGYALVQGRRAPFAGRISMDQSMLDITHIPEAALGSEVVLLGRQGEEELSAETIAAQLGTIPYEVLCRIGARVPRQAVES